MHIAVVGFGVEGRALLAYFQAKGHRVTVCDERENIRENPLLKNVSVRCGPRYLQNLQEFDFVFRSPGAPFRKKEFDAVREKITSATRYFFERCPCPIIGVTGTKGKGTTSTLIFEMLERTFGKSRQIFLGGNIGRSPLEFLGKLSKRDLVVLELSSFQLEDLRQSPHLAVCLGVSPDHLDHHADMEEYVEAKRNIVRFQKQIDFAVVDADNAYTREFGRDTQAKVFPVSTGKIPPEGGFLKLGKMYIKIGKTVSEVGEKGRTPLIGEHNLKNILAASAAASLLGVPTHDIAEVIRSFSGLPHRLERVGEVAGVLFYNDSASTNPETAVAALRCFTSPVILIAGGSDKNADFTPVAEEIAKRLNVETAILMGQTKQKIGDAIEAAVARQEKLNIQRAMKTDGDMRRRDIPLELIFAETYQEAFMVAKLLAKPGTTVLLSPACASFDMFKNYRERGEIFRHFVLDRP